jgi:putative membrane protein
VSNVNFKLMASAIAAAGLMAGVGAAAQTATRPAAAAEAKAAVAQDDRKFVEEAAIGGMAEVELGKMAEQKATNSQVKTFASRMAQDHGKANEELKQLAQSKGISVPTAADKSHQKHMDSLSKLSGAEFDRQYMAHMLADHRKDVSAFKKASEGARDSDIKAFAGKALPTLQEHLKMAQSVNDTVKGGK